MKLRIFTLFTCSLFCLLAYSRPARTGIYTFYQPDGTSFQAKCYGDEFYRIKTTIDGHAIIQGEDSWWCYAEFDASGARKNSGYRVGSETPSEILSESCNIPYNKLKENALRKRQTHAHEGREPLMRRILTDGKFETKAGNTTTKHGLVILAQYSDVKFKHSKNNFADMLNKSGYNYNGATGSAKQYFDEQFEGTVNFEFTVSDIVTLSERQAYYGANDRDGYDKKPEEMVIEACQLLDGSIDFSTYDDDNDGTIDNVFIFFAGEDEANGASEDCIWSHSWYVKSGAGKTVNLDGKTLDCYACTSELNYDNDLAGIGTFCHEYSHTLGLPDFYDTDYDEQGGWAAGLWLSTSLMDGGNMNNNDNTPPYYNAIEREILGLAEPVLLENDGVYTLTPVQDNITYRLNTDKDDEYYLFECRSKSGWDKHIGGNGMLVYHIDKTSRYITRWTENNTVNAFQSHQCADLIEADSRTDAITEETYYSAFKNISGVFFPYNSVNSLTPDSTPGLKFWSGKEGEISINNIKREGDNITFSVSGFSETTTPPVAMTIKTEAFMDAAIINFDSSWAYDGEATVIWGRTGQETTETKVLPYQPGKYSVILENLVPGNKTYSVTIMFTINGVSGNSSTASFMTSKEAPVDWPYIFIGKNKSQMDGTFKKGAKIALRVYNATEAKNVRWTFNGMEIHPGGDGYYALQESGVLRAHVNWEDGSEDIIEKKINIIISE